MLVDTTHIRHPLDGVGTVLAVLAGGRTSVRRLDRGMYELHHHGFDALLGSACVNQYGCDAFFAIKFDKDVPFHQRRAAWEAWEAEHPGLPNSYGVCDEPQQLVDKYPALDTDPRPLVVAFVPIRKADQPDQGGWRWHKWGPYIGDRKPCHEYLYDEPDIDLVYTFNVYEIAPSAVTQVA